MNRFPFCSFTQAHPFWFVYTGTPIRASNPRRPRVASPLPADSSSKLTSFTDLDGYGRTLASSARISSPIRRWAVKKWRSGSDHYILLHVSALKMASCVDHSHLKRSSNLGLLQNSMALLLLFALDIVCREFLSTVANFLPSVGS